MDNYKALIEAVKEEVKKNKTKQMSDFVSFTEQYKTNHFIFTNISQGPHLCSLREKNNGDM